MRVIIMGCGRVGSELSHELADGGHEVAVIDKDPEAFFRYPPGEGARRSSGSGSIATSSRKPASKEADAFVAVSSGDNSNIVSARVALEHYHVPKVVARIYDPRRAEIYERLNIPTVATTTWGIKQIQLMLFHDRKEIRESAGRRRPAAHARAGPAAPGGQARPPRSTSTARSSSPASRAAAAASSRRPTARCRRATTWCVMLTKDGMEHCSTRCSKPRAVHH